MRVPKKNIHRLLSDVKPSAADPAGAPDDSRRLPAPSPLPPPPRPVAASFNFARLKPPPALRETKPARLASFPLHSGHSWFRTILAFAAGLFLTAAVAYFFSLSGLKTKAESSAAFIYDQFRETADYLSRFNPGEARKSLLIADREIKNLRNEASSLGLAQVAALLSDWLPKARDLSASFTSLENLTASAIGATGHLEEVKINGVDYFLNRQGQRLVALLKDLRRQLSIINQESEQVVKVAAADEIASNYLNLKNNLYYLEDFLSTLIGLLDYPIDRHWLIVFQNPSEMRATGGFIGSYADLTLNSGSLHNIDVRDIYDPDGQLDLKIVPPRPLQVITTDWKTRDANWFFDFPTSARKVLSFMNQSKIYTEQGIVFEGLIAINTDLFISLLNLIGPIDLPDYDLTLTPDNFLASIQKEIEIKRSRDKNQPKTILKDLTPIVLERLSRLDDSGKERLSRLLQFHLDNKDILFYSPHPKLQEFFAKHQVAGQAYVSPPYSPDNYLAVVNTNIAGGKTDAFVKQTINLKTEIGLDGLVTNYLSISRSHQGHLESDSWYRTKNQNYLRVLASPDAALLKITGDTPKTVYSPLNYDRELYTRDPDVKLQETAGVEVGKTVFGAWFTVPAGATKSIDFTYQNREKMLLYPGQKYRFIFDKQSGVKGGLKLEISAPPGFKWLENNDFTYTYEIDNSPKRFTLELTLKEI